jgi:hypothetical protein
MTNVPDVHDPEYWLQELRPLLDELYFAFQAALPTALQFFDVFRKKPINGPVLSNLIRYEVLEYLRGRGISAHEDDSDIDAIGPLDGCGMNSLPNNGIELVFRNSCIRLRKGSEPPRPTTDSQIEWYQQLLPFQEEDGVFIATNLLVLWYGEGQRNFTGLKLLRTKNVRGSRVQCDWMIDVPAPPVSASENVRSEYRRSPDLPLDGREDSDERSSDTGTDGH